MKLERLQITRMPGIQEGFTLQPLDPGLNLVTGPNGVGKSSLVRALRYLVDDEERNESVALTLEADFLADADADADADGEDEGESLRVTRTGSQRLWLRNGQPGQPPSLPRGDFLHCYWIAMGDLMGEGATDQAIVAQLQREMAGGFDLRAVREAPDFSPGKRFGVSQEKAFQEKDSVLRSVRQRYQSLEEERRSLPALEEKITAARQADERRLQLEQALRWLDDRQRRLSAAQRLEAFPPGMAQLHGDEAAQLEQRETQIESLEQQLREATQNHARARQRLEETGLAGTPPEPAEIAARREDLSRLARLWDQMEERRHSLAQARAEQQQAEAALGRTGDSLAAITPQQVDRASRVAEQIAETRQRLQALEPASLPEAPGAGEIQAQQRMSEELRRWLRQLSPSRFRHLSAGAATALIASAVLAVLALSQSLTVPMGLSLVALGGAAWSLWQLRGLRRARLEVQQRVAELPLSPPSPWTPGAVSLRLEELEASLARLQLRHEKAEQQATLENQRQALRQSLSELDADKIRLAEETGFDPDATAQGVLRFAHLVQRLDQAAVLCTEHEEHISRLSSEWDETLGRVLALFELQGITLPQGPDLASVRSHFQSLEQRLTQLREARSEQERATEACQRLEQTLAEACDALEALYQRVGLGPGQRRELLALCEQRDEYLQARDQLREARTLEQDRASGLAQAPDLVALVEAGDRETLSRQLESQQSQAQQLESLREQRSALEARLNQAGQDQALARARLEREKARDAFSDAWSRAMQAEAGQFLLQQVTEAYRSEHQPKVLAAARERFAGFTRQRYDLRLDEEGTLGVQDSLLGLRQSPADLSTGTHMQLFLALRLAWTSYHEGAGETLPLFLDEALTTSDPDRFATIVRNLDDLVREEGRQIFYLSAEPGDVRRWEQVLGRDLHHLDLRQLRFGQADRMSEDFTLPPSTPLPSPQGRSPEEYAGLLRVPPIRPHQPAGAIHLFYLLRDDLPTLHRLMTHWRTEYLGPLENLLKSPAATAALEDPARVQQMQGRVRTARVWLGQWLRGRGLPVDRNALEDSGAITGTFMDPVCEQARTLDGDAGALVAALKDKAVPRFKKNKAEELEQWLLENGYLSRESPLTVQEREHQTLLQVGETVPPEEALQVIRWLEGGCSASQNS